jgi:hypothetical protein
MRPHGEWPRVVGGLAPLLEVNGPDMARTIGRTRAPSVDSFPLFPKSLVSQYDPKNNICITTKIHSVSSASTAFEWDEPQPFAKAGNLAT